MSAAYDRSAELRALDATMSGVQGLVASGVTSVPRIFRVPDTDPRPSYKSPSGQETPSIPVIDLAQGDRAATVAAVGRAAAEWGFFQVTGHGVPAGVASGAVEATRAFHEEAGGGGEKVRLYSRDPARAVRYNTNFDLYESKVANWRDTLYITMAPRPPARDELPEHCRDVFFEYAERVRSLHGTLFGLLSEALGLSPTHLADMGCNDGQLMLFHYYPPCPQPELAIGTSAHSDGATFLTVVLQDGIGGLQILHDDRWIDVTPTPGTLIVNVGDLLQTMSNDRFTSAEHRVIAQNGAARVSIACFASDPGSSRMYGPIKELLSDEKPPLYRETLIGDYMAHFSSHGLGPKKVAIQHLRL